MKIYRVTTGYYELDAYGHTTNRQEARYFLNKKEAEDFYNEGKYTIKETKTTTTYAGGYVATSRTGGQFYEKIKATAKPNQVVELVEIEYNRRTFEEIEVE